DRRQRLCHGAGHGGLGRADHLRHRGGRRNGLARRRLHRLAAHRLPADLLRGARLADLRSDGLAGRAGAAVLADGTAAYFPAQGLDGDARRMRYQPLNLARWILWGATAAVFIVAPLVFTSSFALTMLTQMGSFIIFALSYNMLLGQSGMLSFGHAVYSGLGAYIAAHALNLMGKGAFAFPVTLLPLIGGLAGMLF